jgi:hypothetical protein
MILLLAIARPHPVVQWHHHSLKKVKGHVTISKEQLRTAWSIFTPQSLGIKNLQEHKYAHHHFERTFAAFLASIHYSTS